MDFSLSKEQQAWQMKAREFAREEIRPISLKRDQIEGGFAPWDWQIINQIAENCTDDQKERFLKPFLADDTYVMQRVTHLNLGIHSMAGGVMDAVANKLVRDAFIWSHLAGDATQRLKAIRRFPSCTVSKLVS